MNRYGAAAVVAAVSACVLAGPARADDRTQYPAGLANSYFDFNVAYIDSPFSAAQLEPGFRVGTVRVPPVGARLTIGHRFTEHVSVQIVYARPIKWVRYEDVADSDGELSSHSVLTNVAGFTARGTVPLPGPFSAYAEGGLGIVTRSGPGIVKQGVGRRDIIREANYKTVLLGAGLTARLSNAWDLRAGVDYTPAKASIHQPYTLVFSGGAVLNLRPLPAEKVAANAKSGAIFPKNLVQVGYLTNQFGTGVNSLVSSKIPIFWGGSAEVRRAIAVRYQRNIFHTAKLFSLDVGVSASAFRTEKNEEFWAAAVYPQFRFTPIRTKPADVYLTYSLAGPAYISKAGIDGHDTAGNFTFQDLMSLGCYVGRSRHVNLELGIGHYSNGNLTAHNAGVKLPLTFTLGYAF